MKLSTKIITTVAVSAILATAASAYGAYGMMGQGQGGMHHGYSKGMMGHQGGMHQGYGKGMMGHQGGMHHGYGMDYRGAGILPLIAQLNLTDKQEESIIEILEERIEEKGSIYDSFTEEDFDADKFAEFQDNTRKERQKAHAQRIEKIYNVLTAEQKKQLKVLMDLSQNK